MGDSLSHLDDLLLLVIFSINVESRNAIRHGNIFNSLDFDVFCSSIVCFTEISNFSGRESTS